MLQVELMKAESVTLTFTDEAIREIAHIAYEVRSLSPGSSYLSLIPLSLSPRPSGESNS
jgi:hypothetical protein